MASITVDKRTGNLLIRSYGGTDPETGRRLAPSRTLPADATQEEIDAACDLVDMRAGKARKIGRAYTVGGLVAYYLECCEVDGKSPTTVDAYRSAARCYVYPHIGSLPFDKAEPSDFAALYRKVKREGGRGGTPLEASTVRKLHAFLSGCFSMLCAEKIVDRNPVKGIRPPSGAGKEAQPLSDCDMEKLVSHIERTLSACGDDPERFDEACLMAAWWTCLHTGNRRGELAGYLVSDLDIAKSSLSVKRNLVHVSKSGGESLVYKDPKSEAGKRNISLDSKTRDVLVRHLALQARVLIAAGGSQGADTPLFARSDGSPIPPSVLTDSFGQLASELGLTRGTHLHTLRHTHATYLLESGVNIRTVQERLGHSKIEVTLGIYGHVLPGRDQQAAESFGRMSGDMVQRTHSGDDALPSVTCPLTGKTCRSLA